MREKIIDFEPKQMLKYFAEICEIPRTTNHTQKIGNFLFDFLKKNNAKNVQIDHVGNIYGYFDASKGYEKLPIIILQGHIDMVGEKVEGSNHNFLTDPIEAYVENGYIKANGTTLGADNGIALSLIMEIISNPNIKHGPLEVLFTNNEEITAEGAANLSPNLLKGNYLLNLDNVEDTTLVIGCA